MTNYEKLKQKSASEVAHLLSKAIRCCDCLLPDERQGCTSTNECEHKLKEWLESEVSNNA